MRVFNVQDTRIEPKKSFWNRKYFEHVQKCSVLRCPVLYGKPATSTFRFSLRELKLGFISLIKYYYVHNVIYTHRFYLSSPFYYFAQCINNIQLSYIFNFKTTMRYAYAKPKIFYLLVCYGRLVGTRKLNYLFSIISYLIFNQLLLLVDNRVFFQFTLYRH